MGYFIFEGPDGVGKSTLVERLHDIMSCGGDVVKVREPGSTSLGERLRHLLSEVSMSPTSQIMLNFTQRFELFEEVLKPALKSGKVVLSDRGFPSTYVYNVLVEGSVATGDGLLFSNLFDVYIKRVSSVTDRINVIYVLPGNWEIYKELLVSRRPGMSQNKRRLFRSILDAYHEAVDCSACFSETNVHCYLIRIDERTTMDDMVFEALKIMRGGGDEV